MTWIDHKGRLRGDANEPDTPYEPFKDDATGFFGDTDEIAVEEENKKPRKRRKKKHARRQ